MLTPTPGVTPIVIFADDFESGSLSRWAKVASDGGDLRISELPGGVHGLGLFVNDRRALWLKDVRPEAETNYYARFLIEPSGLSVTEGTILRIFSGRMTASSNRPFELRLRRFGGAWQVVGIIRDDAGSAYRTDWYPLLNRWTEIVIGWQRSEAPGADGGGIALWLNGTRVFAALGIDNDTLAIDGIQMGILGGLRAGSTGVLLMDDFVSFKYPPAVLAAMLADSKMSRKWFAGTR